MHSYQIALEGLSNAIFTLVVPHTSLYNPFPGVTFPDPPAYREEVQLLTPASEHHTGDESFII